MQKPVISLNGDNPVTLVEQLNVALCLAEPFKQALLDTMPHGRNYQTRNHQLDFERAREEHRQRLRMLASIVDDLEKLRDYCALFTEQKELQAELRHDNITPARRQTINDRLDMILGVICGEAEKQKWMDSMIEKYNDAHPEDLFTPEEKARWEDFGNPAF